MCLWMHATCVGVPSEAREPDPSGGHQVPESQSYRQLWATKHGCWGLNLRPLEEEQEFLTAEPSPQSREYLFYWRTREQLGMWPLPHLTRAQVAEAGG